MVVTSLGEESKHEIVVEKNKPLIVKTVFLIEQKPIHYVELYVRNHLTADEPVTNALREVLLSARRDVFDGLRWKGSTRLPDAVEISFPMERGQEEFRSPIKIRLSK